MFVALEGQDSTGKSTLRDILAERLGAVAYATPPKGYLERREEIDKNASLEDHYAFYRDGVYDASDEISGIIKDGGRVVSDRYWLSTKTYHEVMGMVVPMHDFKKVVQPTLTVILSLSHAVQMERMKKRGMTAGDKRTLEIQPEIATAYYKNALELGIPFVVIDTQRFSPHQCADIVVTALGA